MLHAVFRGHAGYLFFALAVVIVVGLGCFAMGKRFRFERPWTYGALAAAVTAELCLTIWSTGGGLTGRCIVNRDVWEPLHTEQGLWNLVMFLPIGFFGLLALRKPVPVFAGTVLLTMATEVTQAAFPSGAAVTAATWR